MRRELRRGAAADEELVTDDAGFSLIELIVAMGLIITVLVAFCYVVVPSLGAVAYGNQAQTADTLATRTMEQLRGLEFSAVASGLDVSDVCSDPAIVVTGGTCGQSGASYTYKGEKLVTGAHAQMPPAPITPHTTLQTPGGLKSYQVSSYITQFTPTPGAPVAGAFRLVVVVSWTAASAQKVDQVALQTVETSPAKGCLSGLNHPFAAPCQAYLFGQAGTGSPAITVTPTAGGPTMAFSQGVLELPHTDSTTSVEQVTHVQGSTTTTAAQMAGTGAPLQAVGTAISYADNDPGSTANKNSASANGFSNSATPTATSTLQSPASGGVSLVLTPTNNDVGSTLSAVGTSPAASCGIPTCGQGTVTQQGAASASLTITAGTGSASAPLATVQAPASASTAFSGRFVAAPPAALATDCPASTATNDGCVHAEEHRSYGAISLAALPSGFSAPGWGSTSALVSVSSYNDSIVAETGPGSTGTPKVSTSGAGSSVTYWAGVSSTNPTGFATVPLSQAGNLTIAPATATGTVGGQTVTLTMSGSLAVKTPSSSATACSSASVTCASGSIPSPVTGTISYQVAVAGTTVANLTLTIDLGTAIVQTEYQPAPPAS